MQKLRRRLEQLEESMGASRRKGLQVVALRAGSLLALDTDRCAEILGECGFTRPGDAISVLNFLHVPHGLNAAELERYLRVHGEEVCGLGSRRS